MYQLFGRKGWGSVLVEAQLAWYGLPYQIEEVDDLFTSQAARERLAKVNPVAQLPTLVLPDGTVMTESAAITLYLADITESVLVPLKGHATRARFLRWLVFLVTNIYPTFTMPTIRRALSPGKPRRRRSRKTWTITPNAFGAWWSRRRSALGSWANISRRSTSILPP
jgi:glutathione S-transferase